ncbi:MAG: hypothetical protein WKF78_11685 [Candidatus Limnocylindrales bacterium]
MGHHRVGRDFDPSVRVAHGGEDGRSALSAEVRSHSFGIGELAEDIGVGQFLDVREQRLAGRVGEGDPPVGRADHDAVADGPDDRVELCSTGVFLVGKLLEPARYLQALTDLAGGRDQSFGLSG